MKGGVLVMYCDLLDWIRANIPRKWEYGKSSSVSEVLLDVG